MGKNAKQRIPAQSRWYWVAAGRRVGVFRGWESVCSLVTGYPGANYAWATTEAAANVTLQAVQALQATGDPDKKTAGSSSEQPCNPPAPQQPATQPNKRPREPAREPDSRGIRMAQLRARRKVQASLSPLLSGEDQAKQA